MAVPSAAADTKVVAAATVAAADATVKVSGTDVKADAKAKKSGLGDRMKAYEDSTGAAVPNDQFLLVRADGHHFSRVTANFDKPQDMRITRAMLATATDAMEHFGAVTCYTFSDEISLVFPACTSPEHTHPNSGRVQKLGSRVAGYVSVRFQQHLAAEFPVAPAPFVAPAAGQVWTRADRDRQRDHTLYALVHSHTIYFDARVVGFPTRVEMCNHFVWRSLKDSVRNSIAALAREHLGPKAVVNKNGPEMKALLVAERDRRMAARKAVAAAAAAAGTAAAGDAKAAAAAAAGAGADAGAGKAAGGKAAKNKSKGSGDGGGKAAALTDAELARLPVDITWDEQSAHFKWGSYAKRELHLVDAIDPVTQQPIRVQRFRTSLRAFPIAATDLFTTLVFAKYWPEDAATAEATGVAAAPTAPVAAAGASAGAAAAGAGAGAAAPSGAAAAAAQS